jgi:drug/metabolite transporter (DMT)-like permease
MTLSDIVHWRVRRVGRFALLAVRSGPMQKVVGADLSNVEAPKAEFQPSVELSPSAVATAKPQMANQSLKAIGLMCLAWISFAGIDVSAKYLTTVYAMPVPQVVWARFLGQFAAIVLVMGLAALPGLLASQKPGFQLLRSLLLLGSTLANFIALQYLRIDQTTTISFLTPLSVALLAGPFLGEWVGWRRVIAILVGFSGVLVAVRPGFTEVHPAFLIALMSMGCYALFSLLTRYLSPYDKPEVTLFYSMLAGTFLVAPVAWTVWVAPPDRTALLLLCTIGVWGAIGHYLFIIAHKYAPAAVIAPFVYIALLSHSGAGYVVFGHVPDVWTLSGAAIVIASGLYLIHRERIRANLESVT